MVKINPLRANQGARLKELLSISNIPAAHLANMAGVPHLTSMIKGSRPINNPVICAIIQWENLGPVAAAWVLTGNQKYNIFTGVNFDIDENIIGTHYRDVLSNLMAIEKISPAAFEKATTYIKGMASGLTAVAENKIDHTRSVG